MSFLLAITYCTSTVGDQNITRYLIIARRRFYNEKIKNQFFLADSKTKAIYLHTVKRIFLSENFLTFKIKLRA